MKHQMDLLLYLDKRRFLNEMKNECERILEQFTEAIIRKFPPIRYILHVDVMNLLDFSSELGIFLLEEPLFWQRLCNEVFFACLQSIDSDFNQLIRLSQIATVVRLNSVPKFLTTPKTQTYKGIVTFIGLLIDISRPINYVYHSVWSCPEQCEGNEVILHFIPKVPPKCCVCRSVLFENSGFRRCGDQVIAKFKLKNELLCKKFVIQDDLITILKLGGIYSIQTIVLKKMTAVWSIEETVTLAAPMSSPIPPDIKKLFTACGGLPWKFIYCLASTIGCNIAPLSCFMNVKINLLLSLASVKANVICGSTILHCLASGYDTGYVGQMMMCAAKLAQYVLLGTSNTSMETALVAASGGVCIMPLPFQAYNQRQCCSILSALETGEITHDTTKVPLKCAVWVHGMDFKKSVFYNVSSVFRNICRGDYGEYEEELAEHILQQAIEPVETSHEELQALKDVSVYLDLIAGIKVSIDVKAENLLRHYFLAARKERPKTVTVGGMSALVDVCTTSAKLCRRTIANSDDATFAIWLHVSGIPEPRFAPAEYLDTPADINKLQNVIKQFKVWLEEFTGCRILSSQNLE